MEVVRINGGKPLNGTVRVSGAKNACLPIFAAALLTSEPCIIDNVPQLSDVQFMCKILADLGATVEALGPHTWRVEAKSISHQAPYELVRKMRASICLMGPLVGRLKKAYISLPGGCVIGHRPIDLHLKGLQKLGCTIEISNGYINVQADKARGGYVFLGGRHGSTVTGTANLIMASVLTPGRTYIESAACEPEVVDLCNMLVKMGARIEGIGSHSLFIEGVSALGGCEYRVIPDRIEAGTYLTAGLLTEGALTVEGIHPNLLGAFLHKLEEAGAKLDIDYENKRITALSTPNDLNPIEVITLPYPGFPTDLQAQITTLLAFTPGMSIITERIYPNRFMHVSELQRMGADISLEGASVIIHGKKSLSGAPVMASDLRASAALYLAGIASQGETWVQRVYHIDRGYDHIDEKLISVGACMQRLPASEMPSNLMAAELVGNN